MFAESGNAIFFTLVPRASSRDSSVTVARASEMSLAGASASLTMRAASLLTRAMAFFVWWSSATLGEGTRITGLPMRQNSEMLLAPARLTTRSAAR